MELSHYPSTSAGLGKNQDDEPQPKDTQYLTANCVLMSYFNEDIPSKVDEHFTRSMGQASHNSDSASNCKTVPNVKGKKERVRMAQN